MSTSTIDQPAELQQITDPGNETDPFGLDITFIENTPATETELLCSTGDNCGSSCPSACTTS
ncbi:FxLD family lanthipeptide [Streptomonospora litoralis]|uniref:FxLD family lantipeptide n=1 Tax=Streptomonospora litoralis TaxID=2498135 RepID=A0A4P6Q5Z8_9ACTN|nr:FxLD family lanthipeptide [Streptomonospora litoralis]QBI56125.1 hypothetical protein EKD16_21860 [Streptomonospora litoralis]